MMWYSHLFKNFPQFVVILTVKGLSVVNEAEVNVFLEFLYFLHDPMNVDNLISVLLPFLNATWMCEKFSAYILLKTCLKDFEQTLASM